MGTFTGHIDEGIVFILLAFWWMINMFRDYQKAHKLGLGYRSHLSYSTSFRGRRIPLEILLKTLFPLGGFFGEVFIHGVPVRYVNDKGQFMNLQNLEHMSIYGLFTLHGIVDLLSFFRLSPILKEMKYITMSVAFYWYASQFYHHSDASLNKPPLENMVHRLPITVLLLIAVMLAWEMRQRETIVPQLFRCFAVLTLGTWFANISFILFKPSVLGGASNPAWDQHEKTNVQFVTSLYGFHIIANFSVMLLIYAIISSFQNITEFTKRIVGQITAKSHYKYTQIGDNVDIDADDKTKLLDADHELADTGVDSELA